ncbi:S8 family serine peptidase [Micromonospora phytophila]|uniref:S8 family serine peptidase n=1 Tax=Micromonospora phytophila TaxID=709888 RepID=UPI00202E44EC|nr:S8 family serine peptidase [Micromonospora phytophila]MCM0677569.1 S8 family serine peptidase [Micromonospora phytophila]
MTRPRSVLAVAGAAAAALAATTALTAPASAAPLPSPAPADSSANQYIVKFKAGADRGAALRQLGGRFGVSLTEVRQLAVGAHVVRASGRTSGLVQALAARGDVEYVEADTPMYALSTPNDPSYPEQWHYYETTGGINAPAAWDVATGGGTVVAVLDTGRTAHPDLDANTVAGYDFISSSTNARDGNGRDANPQDEGDWNATDGECGVGSKAKNSSWHGTHVAGTIAAVSGNGVGVAGVAPAARVQHLRVLGKCGGTTSDIADAIVWASGGSVSGLPANATPAKVINMSLGGSGACSRTYQNAITSAVRRGTTVVVSAGNSNANASGFSPASCANVVSVAALDRDGNRAFYSNYGSAVDVSAPGGEVRLETDPPGTRTTPQNGVVSTMNGGTTTPGSPTYTAYMGTSMSAPHVAGIAALVLGKAPTLTPAAVESALKANSRAIPGTCSGGCGAGLVDAAATVGVV